MGGGHQIDIVGAGLFQLKENMAETFRGNGLSGLADGNIVVLAEDAPQIATGEKDGTGAFGAGYAGLLPKVERSPGCQEPV